MSKNPFPDPGPSVAPSHSEHLPTLDATQDFRPASDTKPHHSASMPGAPLISGYRINHEIAKGGMGRVYAASDLTLGREVAIKMLLPGANADRFVTESKITARLPHPGIPPVHALGSLDNGVPFLVMKLIQGRTLDELLRERPSPLHELSRFVLIFEQIAQAVGFAHSRGAIHRDLKPLNVMVGEHGEVQVMDWGLAKFLAERETATDDPSERKEEYDQHTAFGSVMGTPGYMAPEQARGEAVDERADVFSLGATLAAILTGQPAFLGTTVRETVDKAARGDLADVTKRLTNSGADPELISLGLRCLAAQANDRPANGHTVAAEVAAYRAGVDTRLKQAETASAEALVREQEQRKRRRTLIAAGALVLAVLVLGLGVSLWQMNRAIAAEATATANAQKIRQERDAKELALRAEQQAKQLAELRQQEAVTNLGYARQGNEILSSIFKNLNPEKESYATVAELRNALGENLKTAAHELESSAIGDPMVVADMQITLGNSLVSLGEHALAIDVLEKAWKTRQARLGPDHSDTLMSMLELGSAYGSATQFDKSIPLLEQTLSLMKEKMGADHEDALVCMRDLAWSCALAGQFDKSLTLYEDALNLAKEKYGPNHSTTFSYMNSLATGFSDSGQPSKALPLYEQVLEFQKTTFGADAYSTFVVICNLGSAYNKAGQYDKALPLLKQTLPLLVTVHRSPTDLGGFLADRLV